MSSADVGLQESVPLVGAFAWRLAEEMSIRALLIKGEPATSAGVRSRRPSVDADLWVDPRHFDSYVDRLTGSGWEPYAPHSAAMGWGHAVTMVHAEWPCAIDVHRWFPGFLTEDAAAFEQAWRTRTTARIAHQDVAVPSRVVAAAVTVLHAARSTTIFGADDDRSCALRTAKSFSELERHELSELVSTTGSVEPLADLLREARCEVSSVVTPDARRLEEWRTRLSVGAEPGGGWLLALRAAPWRQRPGLLVAAARPAAKDYAESGADRSARGHCRAALYRWCRSARALPGAIRLVRGATAARTR
jgi:hypothetical protein